VRRITLAIGAAILLASVNFAALADEVMGAIVSVDLTGGTVTLDSGQTFILTETVDPTALEIGEDVTVTYELTTDGLHAATMIAPRI
jgi:hypothetical protein